MARILVAVLVTGALAGCSGDDRPTGAGEASVGTGAPATTDITGTAGTTGPAAPEAVMSTEALYDAPDPVPDVAHGTLLRYQRMDESVSATGSTYRIMYASRSLAGEPIVVTGQAVVPDTPAPPGGRPVVSIGHGTTGIADACAPSRLPPREALLGALAVERGWVTVISDYEGLGTPGRHPYLVGESAGRGVLDAAVAVAQLPGADTSDQLALAGYSQGGQAVLFARQLAPTWTPELQVVGTAAGAPVSGLAELLDRFLDGPQAGFFYLTVAGFAAAHPEADVADVLTPEGTAWLDVVDTGCKAEVFDALVGRRADELVRPTRLGVDPWPELLARHEPGQVAGDTPVLVLHNPADEVIPLGHSEALVTRLCAQGDDVELVLLDEATHLDAGTPAYLRAFDWLAARLDGTPTTTSCPTP